MFIHVPDHFSSSLRYNVNKTPATVTDRSAIKWVICGWLFGGLMLWLSVFELFSFFKAERETGESFLLVEIFAFIMILTALGLIIYSLLSFIRRKKFIFDGENFKIIYHPAIGVKHELQEPVNKYMGVRLRVLFVHSGIFNKNRYIIDLFHQDENKIVPLYISTKGKNIRQIWEQYARIFKMPTLSVGDRGMVQREYEDLDKSIKELYQAQKLPIIAGGKLPAPDNLEVTEKKDKTIVEPKGIYWDTFSVLFLLIAIAAAFVMVAGGVYLTIIGTYFPLKYWLFGAVILIGIMYFASKLFISNILVIKNDMVSIVETLFGSEIKRIDLVADKIESVELSYNPTISRYNLMIISDEKLILFGSRLPIADMLWLKDFIIRKLIGN